MTQADAESRSCLGLFLGGALIWQRRFSEAEKVLRPIKKHSDRGMQGVAKLLFAVIAWEKRNYHEVLQLAPRAQDLLRGDTGDSLLYRVSVLLQGIARYHCQGEVSMEDTLAMMDEDEQVARETVEDYGWYGGFTSIWGPQSHALLGCLCSELEFLWVHHNEPKVARREMMLRACLRSLDVEPRLTWSHHYHNIRQCIVKELADCIRTGQPEEAASLDAQVQNKEKACTDILQRLTRRARNKKRKDKTVETGEEEEEEGIECYGCCEGYKETYTTKCGHVFHQICFDKWLGQCRMTNIGPTCPICRDELYV